MAKTLLKLLFSTFILLSVKLSSATSTTKEPDDIHRFSRQISPETLGPKQEKLIHLRFYFHGTVSGRNPTVVEVARAAMTNTSAPHFGQVFVMDDPLTLGPNITSKLVGRAQGVYASASQREWAFLMVLNFAFMEGKYDGSNLSILGRNPIFSGLREMPIVGGSGPGFPVYMCYRIFY